MTNCIDVCEELSHNFIDSSYDTNVNRAFPDARDGLKPSQRACLWEMYKKGYVSSKPHVKSAKISGAVCADLWPHSNEAIYDTFVRMSQSWINNIPEVDFHGSNGNQILGGDSAAAQRYTEARLAEITEEGMLYGVSKNNVDMILNFSEDQEWPSVFPAVFPRLLVNGCKGIGVSIANTWIPMNFQEVAEAILAYIKNPSIEPAVLYPDFPSGGVIVNKNDLAEICLTGRGKVILEAKYSIHKQEITFTEFCYQTYIEPIIEEIRDGIDSGKITGIKEVANKSDKKRLLLTIECERSVNPEHVVAMLMANTSLKQQYNVNQMAIVGKTPTMLTLQDVFRIYVEHNIECICREYKYDAKVTADRIELLEGFLKALEDIENIINIIKSHKTATEAGCALIQKYGFSNRQTKAILDMKLARLAGMEKISIEKELAEKQEYLDKCNAIVESEKQQKKILGKRLSDLVKKFGTPRRTEVTQKECVKIAPAAIKATKCKIHLCKGGYIYRDTKCDDVIMSIDCMSNDSLLLLSSFGHAFRINVADIKDKIAVGAVLSMNPNERIIYIAADLNQTVYMGTCSGIGKATNLIEFAGNTRNLKGMKHFNLADGDSIKFIRNTTGVIKIETVNGYNCCISLDDLTPSGKGTKGVKLIALGKDDTVSSYEPSTSTSVSKLGSKGRKK